MWCIIVFTGLIHFCNSANILVYLPIPSQYHKIIYEPFWENLIEKGHNLTLVTANPIQNENITQIDLSGIYDSENQIDHLEKLLHKSSLNIQEIFTLTDLTNELFHYELSHPDIQHIIKEKPKFDLVITECTVLIGIAFGKWLNAPVIGIISSDSDYYDLHNALGNPANPIVYPSDNSLFSSYKSIEQRIYAGLNYFFPKSVKWYLNSYHDVILKQYFNEDLTSLYEMSKNLNMLFINSNAVFPNVRPLTSSAVDIGGISYFRKRKPLPKELMTFINDNSMETILINLHENIVKNPNFLKSLSECPYNIIFKMDNISEHISPNMIFSTKISNLDILEHSQTKLLITDGDLQLITDAIYSHVPIISIPYYFNDYKTAKKLSEIGIGLSLDYRNLSENLIKKTIFEVINNPKYRTSVKKYAYHLMDQPKSGLQKAVWWTEYVVRNNGARYLKNFASDLPFYEYFLLDVLLFFLFLLLLSIVIMFLLVLYVYKVVKYIFTAMGISKQKTL